MIDPAVILTPFLVPKTNNDKTLVLGEDISSVLTLNMSSMTIKIVMIPINLKYLKICIRYLQMLGKNSKFKGGVDSVVNNSK